MKNEEINREKEIEFIEPPDDYLVEGIFVDWKSAFEYHREVNKLREKHGIRKVD